MSLDLSSKFSLSLRKGNLATLTLLSGSTLSVLTSFNCSTQSSMELNCEDNSSVSCSSILTRHSFAILSVVFLSIFNLYTHVTKPRDFIDQLNIAQTLLGLDFGDKTIGIAVSDKSKTIATPIITIKRKGILKDIEKLLPILQEYNVGGIILGLPLSLDGSENERTEKVRKFAQELKKCKDIKIAFQDERYSSDVIYKELRKNSISKDKIKKKIDQMAASYILQGFLDNAKHTRI